MNLDEIIGEVENIKDNIWNQNKPLLLEVYKKYTNKEFISLLDLLTRDLDKLIRNLNNERMLRIEIKKRQEENKKIILSKTTLKPIKSTQEEVLR